MTETELEILKGLISVVKCYNGKFSDLDIKILKGVYEIVNALEEPERWITVKGNHIPIFKGQTPQQAIEKFYNKQNRTIAGVKCGKPMSYQDANEGRANPKYNESIAYRYNCQSCIAVFEARLKGYDIETLPYDLTNQAMVALSKNPALAYIDKKTNKNPEFTYLNVFSAQECEQALQKQIQTGERYVFGYRGLNSTRDGHVIIVSKDDKNQIFFYDPQNGKHYNSGILKDIAFNFKVGKTIYQLAPQIFRIDDKDLNIDILNKISKPTQR